MVSPSKRFIHYATGLFTYYRVIFLFVTAYAQSQELVCYFFFVLYLLAGKHLYNPWISYADDSHSVFLVPAGVSKIIQTDPLRLSWKRADSCMAMAVHCSPTLTLELPCFLPLHMLLVLSSVPVIFSKDINSTKKKFHIHHCGLCLS